MIISNISDYVKKTIYINLV